MAKRKPKKPKLPEPKTVYDYLVDPKSPIAHCFVSTNDMCTVARLWEGDQSDFHDRELQNATAEINKILDRVEGDNEDAAREMGFLTFQNRLMLAWTRHDALVGSSDDDRVVAKALKIVNRRSR